MESRADTFGAFDFSTVQCSLSRNRYPRIVMEVGRKVTPPIGEVRNNWARVAEFYWSET